MRKKIICILLLLILCFTIFSSCKEKEIPTQYNFNVEQIVGFTRMFATTQDPFKRVKKSFLEANTTYRQILRIEEGEYVYDTVSPESRGCIITETEQLNSVFEVLPEVDFETQMIVFVFYSKTRHWKDRFWGVKKEGDNIIVLIKEERYKYSVSSNPDWAQTVIGLVLDKLDVNKVTVEIFK